MEPDTAPCEKCATPIATAAEVCPTCGYDPQANGRTMRKLFHVVGWLFTASILLAPIGIPMLLLYHIADRRVEAKTPTVA